MEDGKLWSIPLCTVGLALIESIAMAVGLAERPADRIHVWSVIVAVVTMTTGSALLMWIGERITENGVGNGISIVLLFNIISSVPNDARTLFTRFMQGKSVAVAVVIGLLILLY